MAGTQMEMLGRIDERTQLILERVQKIEGDLEGQNGRLRAVELQFSDSALKDAYADKARMDASAKTTAIDERVAILERDKERIKGAVTVAEWFAKGGMAGGFAGIVALIRTFWP